MRKEGQTKKERRRNKRRRKKRKKEENKVLTFKTKSQLAREARKEEPLALLKEPPYPLVPSKKNKECYFKCF